MGAEAESGRVEREGRDEAMSTRDTHSGWWLLHLARRRVVNRRASGLWTRPTPTRQEQTTRGGGVSSLHCSLAGKGDVQ